MNSNNYYGVLSVEPVDECRECESESECVDRAVVTSRKVGDDPFVSCDERHRLLSQPWCVSVSGVVPSRLYVRADGTCSGGSFVRGLGDSVLQIMPVEQACSRDVVTRFRVVEVVRVVESWSDNDWNTRVPYDLREVMWGDREDMSCHLSSGTEWVSDRVLRSWSSEKRLFCEQCRLPSTQWAPSSFISRRWSSRLV